MSVGESLAEAGAEIGKEILVDLVRLAIKHADGSVDRVQTILDAERAAGDAAVDLFEEAEIAKETKP